MGKPGSHMCTRSGTYIHFKKHTFIIFNLPCASQYSHKIHTEYTATMYRDTSNHSYTYLVVKYAGFSEGFQTWLTNHKHCIYKGWVYGGVDWDGR